MLRPLLLPSFAALSLALLFATPARADGGPPGLAPGATMPSLSAEPAAADRLARWEVHAGAEVGGARVSMLGGDRGSVAMAVDLEAVYWRHPHTGFGFYIGQLYGAPWNEVQMDGHSVSRELLSFEPEIVVRSSTQRGRWISTGWTASLGVGPVATRSFELWKHLFSDHAHEKTVEEGVAAGTTAQVSGFVHVGPLAVAIGPRITADSAGDVALTLAANAGAAW